MSMGRQRLGQWFCNAFDIRNDDELWNTASVSEAKRIIIQKYETYDPMFLVSYNNEGFGVSK
jgi:hypothetical protein